MLLRQRSVLGALRVQQQQQQQQQQHVSLLRAFLVFVPASLRVLLFGPEEGTAGVRVRLHVAHALRDAPSRRPVKAAGRQ
eukprot:gene20044-14613_t